MVYMYACAQLSPSPSIKMAAVPILASVPGLNSCPNPTRSSTRVHSSSNGAGEISITRNSTAAGDFFRQVSVASVFVVGVGLNSIWAFSGPASARILPPSSSLVMHQTEDVLGNMESIEDEVMKAEFERWKSKTYALTVPLRIVALNGSLPSVWIKEFLKSQGKRVQFRPEFRQNLENIFHELSDPFKKGKINSRSAAAADLVTCGDSWINIAIGKELIEPIEQAEDEDWFRDLDDKWKVYLRRSNEGNLDSRGRIWAVPYRWGSIVIAYNKREFQKRKLAPIQDWSDLWRPELAGKISMIDSPREIVGAVLKYMGASYNTTNLDSQVVGGKHAVLQQLQLLVQQVRLFDSQHYLKAFSAGDVWVAVGWSSDVIPAAKVMSNAAVIVPQSGASFWADFWVRLFDSQHYLKAFSAGDVWVAVGWSSDVIPAAKVMSNAAVIVPQSGASFWADFWAIPTSSRLVTDQVGGRVRGPSPMVHQWVEFCLQPERALPFKEEIISGASPLSLKAPSENVEERRTGRPKLDTNLIANVPPAEILSKCEFLEPLSEDVLYDYQWLLSSVLKPSHGIAHRLRHVITSIPNFWSEVASRFA